MAAARRRRRQSAGSGWDKYGQRIFGDVIAMASTLAGSRKHLAAERLNELASATRGFTTSVDDLPYLREYTDAAAERIDEIADYVDRTEIPEMLEDIASFAKRQPMASLALGLAAGLVTTQLVRGWPGGRREPGELNSQSGSPSRGSKKRRSRR